MSNFPTDLDSVRVTICPQLVQRRSPLRSSRATSLPPHTGQVDCENRSERLWDMISTNSESQLIADKTNEGTPFGVANSPQGS